MRVIGFILLIAGFFWLAGNTIYLDPLARAVTIKNYEKVESLEKSEFSKSEVLNFVRDGISDFYESLPSYLFPGSFMLIGGLLLAFYGRKRRKDENT